MNRREFLNRVGAGAAASVIPGAVLAMGKPPARRRPNILFIMSDDHAAQAIGCYGGILANVVPTPNIDRIAAEGMLFENCFCTNSICTPSRATVLTGKYSHINGCRTLSDSFDGSQPTFPMLLQERGYHTAVIGKWHLKTEPAGFDYYNVLPGQGFYYDPLLKEKGKPWENGKKGGEKHQGHVTDIITDIAIKFLEESPRDYPFCLCLNFKAPHDLWEYNRRYEQLYAGVKLPEPNNLFDDYSDRGEAIKRCTQKIGLNHTSWEEQTAGMSAREKKKAQYQIYLKKYLRCAAGIDHNVGRILNYMDTAGLAGNTILVYTSDQGIFLGEHGLYDKRFMYEESLRMPLLVRYPGKIAPGSICSVISLNTDFAPTLLDYAGAVIPPDIQGRSLRPVLQGRAPSNWRKSMYYRYWMHGAHFDVPAHFGVRTDRYKLIYYYGLPLDAKGTKKTPTPPEWELFDLKRDPSEMHNLYTRPEYAKVVKKLKAELRRLRKELADDGDGITI